MTGLKFDLSGLIATSVLGFVLTFTPAAEATAGNKLGKKQGHKQVKKHVFKAKFGMDQTRWKFKKKTARIRYKSGGRTTFNQKFTYKIKKGGAIRLTSSQGGTLKLRVWNEKNSVGPNWNRFKIMGSGLNQFLYRTR